MQISDIDNDIRSLTNVDGTLFFNVGFYPEIWKSDGTESGTMKVSDIGTGAFYSNGQPNVNGPLFFLSDNDFHGVEIWTLQTNRLDIRVVDQPTVTSDNGTIDALPENEAWIDEWTSHWVEIWVRSDEGIAVLNAVASVDYDPTLFQPSRPWEFGSAFFENHAGILDTEEGHITNINGSRIVTDLGDDEYVLLARIHFEPAKPGVSMGIDELDPVSPQIGDWIGLIDSPLDVVAPAPSTELWPVIYDLDDSGDIGFGDFSLFSSVFLQPSSTSSLAAKANFDLSGSVGFEDMAFFSANFLLTSTSETERTYPPGFPADRRPSSFQAGSSQLGQLVVDDKTASVPLAMSALGPVDVRVVDATYADLQTGSYRMMEEEVLFLDADPPKQTVLRSPDPLPYLEPPALSSSTNQLGRAQFFATLEEESERNAESDLLEPLGDAPEHDEADFFDGAG